MWAFSSCGKQGLLFIEVCSFLIAITSLIEKHSLYRLQGLQLLLHADSVLVAKEWAKFPCLMWRNWTLVPCIARWILNHWATREVLSLDLILLLQLSQWSERLISFNETPLIHYIITLYDKLKKQKQKQKTLVTISGKDLEKSEVVASSLVECLSVCWAVWKLKREMVRWERHRKGGCGWMQGLPL